MEQEEFGKCERGCANCSFPDTSGSVKNWGFTGNRKEKALFCTRIDIKCISFDEIAGNPCILVLFGGIINMKTENNEPSRMKILKEVPQ